MTRTIGNDLKTHLAQEITTTAFLWRIQRVDATEFFFTDHDVDIVYGGDTYKAINSASISGMQQSGKLNTDTFDFEMLLDSADITAADLRAGRFNFADVWVYLINYADTTQGIVSLMRGKLGEIEIKSDGQAKAEFRSLAQLVNQAIGRVLGPECDADLGDARCGVTLATYTETGTLTGVTDNKTFADSSRSEANDYFNYGVLTWTGGNNNGLSKEVKDFVNATGTFTLVGPMPFAVQVGDTYSVYAGCDKTKSICKDTFSNLVNFRGFPSVPGLDSSLEYPDAH